MGSPLPKKCAVGGPALLGRPESLEALLDDSRVFSVVVSVHLDIGRRYVHLITTFLDAVVMRLLLIVRAIRVPIRAIVQRAVPHETVLEALIAFLVPLEVPDHLLLLQKHPRVTVQAVEVLPVVEILAVGAPALDARRKLLDVLRVVHLRLSFVEAGIRLSGLLGRRGRRRQRLGHHRCEQTKPHFRNLKN